MKTRGEMCELEKIPVLKRNHFPEIYNFFPDTVQRKINPKLKERYVMLANDLHLIILRTLQQLLALHFSSSSPFKILYSMRHHSICENNPNTTISKTEYNRNIDSKILQDEAFKHLVQECSIFCNRIG